MLSVSRVGGSCASLQLSSPSVSVRGRREASGDEKGDCHGDCTAGEHVKCGASQVEVHATVMCEDLWRSHI